MRRLAVFAYASLVSRESAAATLGREVPRCPPARLPGWRRRWSVCRDNLAVEKTFARRDDGSLPERILSLNLEPSDEPAEAPNGVLLAVTEQELRRLDLRELRHRRVEVTDDIPADARGGCERVFAYTARNGHFTPSPRPGAVVLAAYLKGVRQAFAGLGEDELRLFDETTPPPPVEVTDGVLVHDRIPPGNPKEW